MLIDDLLPQVIGGRSTLEARLRARALELKLPTESTNEMIGSIPLRLLGADCFLDKVCQLWRYEFGVPYETATGLLWSTDMWPLVNVLHDVVRAVLRVLAPKERRVYFTRLSDRSAHQPALVEFMPILRLPVSSKPDYEVPTGSGGSTVDWRIPTETKPVLLDVKWRFREAIEMAEQIAAGERASDGSAPDPKHDPAYLFRSVAEKFNVANPDAQLQGAWIAATFQQVDDEVRAAFSGLDADKVHFAVLGNWEPGFTILYRRDADLRFLERLLGETSSPKYLYRRRS